MPRLFLREVCILDKAVCRISILSGIRESAGARTLASHSEKAELAKEVRWLIVIFESIAGSAQMGKNGKHKGQAQEDSKERHLAKSADTREK